MDFYSNSGSGIFAGILGLVVTFAILFLLIGLVLSILSYVFSSLSLYTLAQNRNLKYPGLAWVPIGRDYLMGALLNDQVSLGSLHIPFAAILLPVAGALLTLSYGLMAAYGSLATSLLCTLTILALSIYQYAAYYWLFRIYNPKNAVLYLVLSIIFFGIPAPFFLFSLRKKTPDFTGVPQTPPCTQNPRGVLAVSLGAIALVCSFVGSGALWSGVGAIIFGIFSLNENKLERERITLPVLGIVLGGLGILLSILLPTTGLISDHSVYGTLQDILKNTGSSAYPFL